MATIGKPAIVAPGVGTDKALKTWQQQLNNINERFRAIEGAFSAFETLTTQRASAAATSGASIERRLRDLLLQVEAALADAQQLLALFSLEEPFEDGDIWVYRDTVAQFVPEPGGDIGSGGVLPIVTGEILSGQPVFVYLPDGSLVYGPVAA